MSGKKTITVTFTEGQLLALWYLAADASDGGWGEPFKDWYEVGRDDIDPDEEIKPAYKTLCKAVKDHDIKAR